MISDHDRSGWFGASDTKTITGNWETKTFRKWWLVKLGIMDSHFQTKYTMAGTYYEHAVLEAVNPHMITDEQFIINSLRLRVKLDGRINITIYECKTFKKEKGFKVSRSYWEQVQVQMYATKIYSAYICAYGLTEREYKNYFIPIDESRIKLYPIYYDENFINTIYLPRIRVLSCCLEKEIMPRKDMMEQ